MRNGTTSRSTKRKTAQARSIAKKPAARKRTPKVTKNADEKEYLKALRDECPLSEWRLICRKAVDDAKEGDAKARQWLNEYLVGKPQHDTAEPETAESFAKSILDSVREMSGRTNEDESAGAP